MNISTFTNFLNDYKGISKLVKEYSEEEISECAAGILHVEREALKSMPMGGYAKRGGSGAYQYVLRDIIKNIRYYDWLFYRLEDEKSRNVFTNLMRYRIVPDMTYIAEAYDGENDQYFDKEIVTCKSDEVFVDCGGYIGDSTESFINNYKEYKRIYVYKPLAENIAVCRDSLKQYEAVEIRNLGVGEKTELIQIAGSGASGSFSEHAWKETIGDGVPVKIISLDEDIKEAVTFIKMDVEGFEIPAILGAKNHIREDAPKLAICTYHTISDMWEIPKLIDYIRPDYRFYLRHYMKNQNWETVLYAIPRKKEALLAPQTAGRKRVVAMAPYESGWSNVELIKDCGLIPYLLYKNHNCDVIMAGAGGNEYPYYEKYVKGIKMEFFTDGSEKTKLNYISENAEKIDCLILRGCYSSNFKVAGLYKEKNPQGKIYVGLDANSSWMDRIIWDNEEFKKFMDCCDVIATSCKIMQEHLNIKWPWRIEHIPNGCYTFGNKIENSTRTFNQRENVIMTVGRPGTKEKATHVLTEAFALAAEELSGWRLLLVGNTNESFRDYMEQYYQCFPMLKGRIEITGAIQDRERLFEMYRSAKIFALTSVGEGGTPNVIAEALNAGCVIATTKIDAWEEAIDGGNCGLASEINDIKGYADILVELCNGGKLEEMSENAMKYSMSHFNMESIVAGLYELLFGGEHGKSYDRE